MRTIVQWILVPAAVLSVAACSRGAASPTNAMSDDLKRDLKLASQTQTLQINPAEVSPDSHQELALTLKKAPRGLRVMRSERPTRQATVRAVQAADIKTDVPQVQVLASAPASSETPSADAPPMARPVAIPVQSYPSAGPIPATGGGGIWGGILGAVIRGGVVDDDHCDPRGATRRGGHTIGGDVYGGGMSRPGGIAGIGGMRRRWP